jgi:hypothetical protein
MSSSSRTCWKLAGVAAFLLGTFAPGFSYAVTCTVDTVFNPDPSLSSAAASDATGCGLGTINNDTAGEVEIATGTDGWFFIEKDEAPDGQPAGDGVGALSSTGSQSGRWMIDLALTLDATDLLIVLNDGGTGPDQSDPKWVWFRIDMGVGANVCSATDLGELAGADLCGDYSMWGGSYGNLKNISHMTLYGLEDGTPPTDLPAPGTVLLFGLGLAGLALVRRRRPR